MTPEKLVEANNLRKQILEMKAQVDKAEHLVKEKKRGGDLRFMINRSGFNDGGLVRPIVSQEFSELVFSLFLLEMKKNLEDLEQEMREL